MAVQKGKFHVYEIKDDMRVVSAIANATLYFLDVNDQEQFKLTAKTDKDGNFNFDLALGEYVVLATAGDGLEQVLANGSTFVLTAQSKVSAFEEWLNKPNESVDSSLLAKFRELMQRTETAAERSENASQIVDANLEENLNKLSEQTNSGLSALAVEKNNSIKEIKDTASASKADLQTTIDSANATKSNLEQAAQVSVDAINDTKASAETSINSTKQQAEQSISQAKTSAENDIKTERQESLQAVASEKAIAISAVNNTKDDAIEEISGKIEGLATESYVDTAVSNVKVDLSGYATETFVTNEISKIDIPEVDLSTVSSGALALSKKDPFSTIFKKTGATSISIKENTAIFVNGKWVKIETELNVSMPTLTAGEDYAVFFMENGKAEAKHDPFESPATSDGVLIGGFHMGQLSVDATVSSGGFATSNTNGGMIWAQDDVDKIRGINEFSFWDLRFRGAGKVDAKGTPRHGQLSNHGMVFDPISNIFVSIYHISTDVDKHGVSRANTDMASGTVKPLITIKNGGDGVKKYGNLNWWTAKEIIGSHGARLLFNFEFNSRAYGVTENKNAGGSAVTYPKTERIPGLTSRIGCEQASGVAWYWGVGGAGNPPLFGGDRTNAAADLGSRSVTWNNAPSNSRWLIGAVAARDLLIL